MMIKFFISNQGFKTMEVTGLHFDLQIRSNILNVEYRACFVSICRLFTHGLFYFKPGFDLIVGQWPPF